MSKEEELFGHDPQYQEAIPRFIRKDGTRPWHTRFEGISNPETGLGACLWIGDGMQKYSILPSHKDITSSKTFNSTVNTWHELYEYYLDEGATYSQTHLQEPCGESWIGLARFPLPETFHTPLSTWPGWTHIFHLNTNFFSRDVQVAAFDFASFQIKQTGYPDNLQEFSFSMLRHLMRNGIIAEIPKYSLDAFPWISDKLVQPQFEDLQ